MHARQQGSSDMSGGHEHPDGLLGRIASWFRGGELAGLEPDDVERMASDIGLTGAELRDLAARGADGTDLLYARMAVLGVNRADLDRLAFGLSRDLEKDCACCDSRKQCTKELAQQPEAPGWMAYCANAATLQAAQKLKGRALI